MFVCLFGCFVLFVCSVFCICKNCQIPKTERYFQEISRCSRFYFVLLFFNHIFFLHLKILSPESYEGEKHFVFCFFFDLVPRFWSFQNNNNVVHRFWPEKKDKNKTRKTKIHLFREQKKAMEWRARKKQQKQKNAGCWLFFLLRICFHEPFDKGKKWVKKRKLSFTHHTQEYSIKINQCYFFLKCTLKNPECLCVCVSHWFR